MYAPNNHEIDKTNITIITFEINLNKLDNLDSESLIYAPNFETIRANIQRITIIAIAITNGYKTL